MAQYLVLAARSRKLMRCTVCSNPLAKITVAQGRAQCSFKCYAIARRAKPKPAPRAPKPKCSWCLEPLGADHVQLGDVALHEHCRAPWQNLNPPPPEPPPRQRWVRINAGAAQRLALAREPLADDHRAAERRTADLDGDERFIVAGLALLNAEAKERARNVRIRRADPILEILSSVL